MRKLRTFIIGLLMMGLGLCLPCRAETVARVDRRSGLPESSDYYVVICARESEPWGTGHTFVVWVQQDKQTGEIHSQGFGFYPEVEKVIVRLFTGDGAVRDESTKSASVKPWLLTHRLIVHVDRREFEAGRNCTHFGHDVARAIGLDAPDPEFGERPALYVGRLMTLNPGQRRSELARLPATLVNARR